MLTVAGNNAASECCRAVRSRRLLCVVTVSVTGGAGVPEADFGSDVVCGTLTVPENRSKADGRTITLTVARYPAQSADPDPEPMVYLHGGPGGTILPYGETLRKLGINRDRDVILVSERGTLLADPHLGCPEFDEVTEESKGVSSLDPALAARSVDAVRVCHDRLAAKGIDLTAYNTVENAADFADLRRAMGIESWHVYGVSYGTYVALQLIRDHPEGSAVWSSTPLSHRRRTCSPICGAAPPVASTPCSTPVLRSRPVPRPIPISPRSSRPR